MRFIKFAMVGAGGFLVDVLVTYMLSQLVFVELARGMAFWVAASSNWWLNRQFTFCSSQQGQPFKQWVQFLSASVIGFLPNMGCYWFLINSGIGQATSSILPIEISIWWPYMAMVPGILLGMGVNFMLAERWVFRLAATR